jgi:hypothetical protein
MDLDRNAVYMIWAQKSLPHFCQGPNPQHSTPTPGTSIFVFQSVEGLNLDRNAVDMIRAQKPRWDLVGRLGFRVEGMRLRVQGLEFRA